MWKWTLVLALSGLPASLHAQSVEDSYWIEGSYFRSSVDSDIRVDNLTTARPGTKIDLESDLDLGKHDNMWAASGGAKISSNWRVIAEYYAIKRDSTAVLDRDITYDGVTYAAAGEVSAAFDSNVYRLGIGYDVAKGENYVLGGVLGLHATDFSFSIEGDGTVNGTPASGVSRKKDALAPLPTVGVYAIYEVVPKLTLNARGDFMSLSIDDYDGRLINLQASAIYRFHPNIGVGVGYRYVDYRLDVEKTDWFGRVRYKFHGPSVYLQAGF